MLSCRISPAKRTCDIVMIGHIIKSVVSRAAMPCSPGGTGRMGESDPMGNAGKREWGSVRRFLVFLLALLMAPAERSGTVYGAKKLTPHSLRACTR